MKMELAGKDGFEELVELVNSAIPDREAGAVMYFVESGDEQRMPVYVKELIGAQYEKRVERKVEPVGCVPGVPPVPEGFYNEVVAGNTTEDSIALHAYAGGNMGTSFVMELYNLGDGRRLEISTGERKIEIQDAGGPLVLELGTPVSSETCKAAFSYVLDEVKKEGKYYKKGVFLPTVFPLQFLNDLGELIVADKADEYTSEDEMRHLINCIAFGGILHIRPRQTIFLLNPDDFEYDDYLKMVDCAVVVSSKEDLPRHAALIERLERNGIPVKVFS